jgi:hypothetical protein
MLQTQQGSFSMHYFALKTAVRFGWKPCPLVEAHDHGLCERDSCATNEQFCLGEKKPQHAGVIEAPLFRFLR